MLSRSNRRIVNATAAIFAASCEDCNGNHSTAEADVENYAEEGEESNASKEASENDGESGVDDSSA